MKKTIGISMITMLLLLVFAQVAGAATPTQRQYGRLISVTATGGDDVDNFGRFEFTVAMEIDGVRIYLKMRMSLNERDELRKAEGEMITIFYHWDGHGNRIYDGFKYGDHIDDLYYQIKDNVLYQIHPEIGEIESFPIYTQ